MTTFIVVFGKGVSFGVGYLSRRKIITPSSSVFVSEC